MAFKKWYETRGLRFILKRGNSLLKRYGFISGKAVHRIGKTVEVLARSGCAPTFPTPGSVLKRNHRAIQHFQELGAEIAVHSFNHINLSEIPANQALQQLMHAVDTFERFGIEVHGFRCPYLGYSTKLLDSIPGGIFKYSSNEAVYWQVDNLVTQGNLVFEKIGEFYHGKTAADYVCVPTMRANFIEIPVCVPDDLQLYDGLGVGSVGIAQVWQQILDKIYQRGELFTLLFHPELGSFLEDSFVSFLQSASHRLPNVWITRLRDISDWWLEKSKFKVDITPITSGLRLNFSCTPRATILARGLDNDISAPIWEGRYRKLDQESIEVPADLRPFVGIAPGVPESVLSFLQDQGYICDYSGTARSCGIYIDNDIITKLSNNVELVNFIETSSAALVRFWRWPYGSKCALSITGDLDALSLLDYATRWLN